jgi:Uma2 family endonuclease
MTAQLEEPPVLEHVQQEEDEEKMASGLHGITSAVLSSFLVPHVYGNNLGHVFVSNTTFAVLGKPPKRQPDVAFVKLEKLPEPTDEEIPFAPDFAVEVVSKNDVLNDIKAKAQQYLDSGTQLVWYILPVSRLVQVYRPETGQKSQEFGVGEELDATSVLPGFKLRVDKLFPW